jgi:hypothetical protein
MRHELRLRLDTALPEAEDFDEFEAAPEIATNAPRCRADAEGTFETFTAALRTRERAELLLGFPAAPFILALGADDPDRFIEYAEHHPTHAVRLRRPAGSGGHTEWAVSPWEGPDTYLLTFSLPDRIESWISENEERRVSRTSDIKSDFLSEITIYRRLGDNMRIYQLRYEPSQLHR